MNAAMSAIFGGKMKNFKRIIALALSIVLTVAMVGCSTDGIKDDNTQTELVQSINATGKYLTRKITSPKYGDENAIIALNRSTYIDFWHNRTTLYVSKINGMIKNNGYVLGKKHEVYADGYPDVILTMTTAGIYANLSSSQDLIEGISFDKVVMMGGPLNKVDALTALECGKYAMVERGDLTRQDLIDFTMELQQADGSFSYADMGEVTKLEVTASAVTGLALTGEKGEIQQAVDNGVKYLVANISEDDKPTDIVKTIIALNTAGMDVTDVDGKDLLDYIMAYARDDGSFSFDKEAKKGNTDDTAWAMLALASQYRFTQGMTSIYDMTDVVGGTHNQLSPSWMAYLKIMIVFTLFSGVFMLFILIRSKFRIKKRMAAGLYDQETNRILTEEEAAQLRAEKAAMAAENAETSEEAKE